MIVERHHVLDENGRPDKITFRLMQTTCPKCHQAVQFCMLNEEFEKEENKFLRKRNDRLIDELNRLHAIIDGLLPGGE